MEAVVQMSRSLTEIYIPWFMGTVGLYERGVEVFGIDSSLRRNVLQKCCMELLLAASVGYAVYRLHASSLQGKQILKLNFAKSLFY